MSDCCEAEGVNDRQPGRAMQHLSWESLETEKVRVWLLPLQQLVLGLLSPGPCP